MKRDTPPHTCHYMLTKTLSSGREYRACPVCGATPAQTIILTAPDHADQHRPAPVCADESRASVRQGTVCGNQLTEDA
jgi:hypothetical protein